jgi:hypothetical protein
VVFNARGLGDAGIGNNNVEPISDQFANARRKLRSRLRLSQIRTYSLGLSSIGPDVLDEASGFLPGFSVMDKDTSASIRQGDRSGAPNSSGCAGYKGCLVGKICHVLSLLGAV